MLFSQKLKFIAILWPSFVSAGVFAGIFFAFIDPLALSNALGIETSPRLAGYSMVFFFFWGLGAVSTAAAISILNTAKKR